MAAERSAARIEARRRVLLRPGVHMFDSTLRTKRGEHKCVQAIVKTVDLSGRKYFLAMFRDFTEKKAAEQKMKEYHDQLRRMATELSLTQERERKHIADELHDHLSQDLSLCRISLERLRELLDKPEARKVLKEIEQCVDSSLRYSRTLTSELCPLVLYELGFEPAVAWLAENIGATYGIKISVCNHARMSRRRQDLFAEPARIILFQAVRELLLNVVRHAGARRIWVTMSATGRNMKVTIRDDGAGFDTALNHRGRRRSSYGLFSLRERLLALGGALHLESTPGKGTRVVFSVPIRSGGEEP